MEITVYHDPAAFLVDAQAFFEANEAPNSLINGAAQRLLDEKEEVLQQVFLSLVCDQGDPVMAATMRPPHPLQLSYTPDAPHDALQLVVDTLQKEKIEFPRVLGPEALTHPFSQLWSAATDCSYSEAIRMRFYCMTAAAPLPLPEGTVHIATEDDRDLVIDWLLAMHEQIFEHNVFTREQAEDTADLKIPAGDAFFWMVDGEPVSTAHRTRPTKKGWCINAVYTPPEHRNRGYATACVAHAAQSILDAGKDYACLFADQSNPVSNSIYQKIGFEACCDFVEYQFE